MRRLQIKLNHSKSNQMLVFDERGKPEFRGKNRQNRVENQQTQSTYEGGSGNRTRFILVEGDCSLLFANPALTSLSMKVTFQKHKQTLTNPTDTPNSNMTRNIFSYQVIKPDSARFIDVCKHAVFGIQNLC